MSYTANGALTNPTSGNPVLDLFQIIGSARNMSEETLQQQFQFALLANEELALRVLLWARDIRGGAGERRAFRVIYRWLCENKPLLARKVTYKIPELGRFDDLFTAMNTPAAPEAFAVWFAAIEDRNQLAAKWTPRKGPIRDKLTAMTGWTPRQFRKTISSLTNVVEQKMCAKQWNDIEFGKLPSIASARYQQAFARNATEAYNRYREQLKSSKAKINANAIFPHDVVRGTDSIVADAQWKALPDYIPAGVNILPIIDVSSSMFCSVGNNHNLAAIDIAVALGIYCSERIKGKLNRYALTFHTNPHLVKLPELPILATVDKVKQLPWCGKTDFTKAMELVLDSGCPDDQLPQFILCISDMEFNEASYGGRSATNFDYLRKKYGKRLPKLVFWNVNARIGNSPVTVLDENAVAISGYSPAILKAVLAADEINPYNMMLDVIMVDRYKLD